MLKRIALLFFILLINLSVFGQAEKSGWKIYTIGRRKISIALPKLPVVIRTSDRCREIDQESFYAYEKEVVYSLTIYFKLKDRDFKNCEKTESFSAQTYNARIEALKQNATVDEKAEKNLQNRELTVLHTKTTGFWIYNDLKNDRWIELSAVHREDTPVDAKKFADSFKFDISKPGIEIGDGSPITLGDINTSPPELRTTESSIEKSTGGGLGNGVGYGSGIGSGTGSGNGIGSGIGNRNGTPAAPDNPKPEPPKTKETSAKSGASLPLMIVAKPRANYTDAARTMQAQGTVALRVTFQANGGIGSVSVVSGVDYGLTEQAVVAAKKIVFLPAKQNGILVTVSKQVQYSFTIY